YQRITLSSLQPAVAGYAAAVVEHLHSCFGHADVHAFTNQVVGDGILVPTVRDKIVARNLGDRPDSGFKGTIRQPQHVGLFFFQIGTATAASHLLERAAVQFFQDRKSTRLNSSHVSISYAVFCLKKKICLYASSDHV